MTSLNIVGGGDVVAHRIVPALLQIGGVAAREVHVHVLDAAGSLLDSLMARGVHVHVHDQTGSRAARQATLIAELIESALPTIVATPSDAHWPYAAALTGSGLPCAVEKPLSSRSDEIDELRRASQRVRSKLFALSYYGLEKALPVTYLLHPNAAWEPCLELDRDPLTAAESPPTIDQAVKWMQRLGDLVSLRVDLIEGPDRSPVAGRREWTERSGGLSFETLVHPLILAQKFARQLGTTLDGFEPSVQRGRSRDAALAGATTFLRLDGALGSARVTLTTGKYADAQAQRRRGLALFTGGQLEFDFDAMSAVVRCTDGRTARIFVREAYRGKYLVQARLMLQFFALGWQSVRFDDFDDQLAVLSWLQRHELESGTAFDYGASTGVGMQSLHAALNR